MADSRVDLADSEIDYQFSLVFPASGYAPIHYVTTGGKGGPEVVQCVRSTLKLIEMGRSEDDKQ